jgi:hypothetical protein
MKERFCLIVGLLVVVSTTSRAQLGTALNAPSYTWTTSGTGGSPGWASEVNVSHDGLQAAETVLSPSPSGPQTATVQTTAGGPGSVSFWWYGADPDPDTENSHMICYIDNVPQVTNSTPSIWYRNTVWLSSGVHTVKWVYSVPLVPNPTPGYLDQVQISAGTTPPSITIQPFSQSVVRGLNAAFAVGTIGTPPMQYQWQLNGTNISGATNNSYTVTNAQLAKLGTYHVVVSNSAGTNTSADASLEFGEVAVWGENSVNDNRGLPPLGATNVTQISGGWQHSLLLRTNGTIVEWGDTNLVQAAPGATATNLLSATALPGSGVVLNSDGTVIAWGNSSITNVPPDLTNVIGIAAGPTTYSCLALKSDGTVVGWGDNIYGLTNVSAGLSNVVSIAAGQSHALALKSDGTIATWGDNTYGQRIVPVAQLNSSSNRVVAIAAGAFHSVALRSDGVVFAWGQNGAGQTNVPVAAKSGVIAIAAGFAHCLALRTNGTVVAWGRNEWGQTNTPSNLSNVVAIAAGAFHSLALVGTAPTGSPANATVSSNAFSVSIPSQAGHVFELDYKTSFTDTNWTPLPLTAGNGANLILTDTNAIDPQRFYRVRRW